MKPFESEFDFSELDPRTDSEAIVRLDCAGTVIEKVACASTPRAACTPRPKIENVRCASEPIE